MKNFFRKAGYFLLGTGLGFVFIPLSIGLSLYIACKFLKANSLKQKLFGLVIGLVGVPIVAIASLLFPVVTGAIALAIDAKNQKIAAINQQLFNHIKDLPQENLGEPLTESMIQQINILNACHPDEQERQAINEALALINTQSPLGSKKYYQLKQPVCIEETNYSPVKGTQVSSVLYERNALLKYFRKKNEDHEVACNPLNDKHKFKLNQENECKIKNPETDCKTTYQFKSGFSQAIAKAIKTVRDFYHRYIDTKLSTGFINTELSITAPHPVVKPSNANASVGQRPVFPFKQQLLENTPLVNNLFSISHFIQDCQSKSGTSAHKASLKK